MNLTEKHIEQLYAFTRHHFVEYYDLQTELVDHLANSIEAQWIENPKLPFEEALQVEFKKFGVFGFMDVVEQRQLALGKKYNKLVWNHLKEFFTFPKIMLTFSAIIGIALLLKNLKYREEVFIVLILTLIVIMFRNLIKNRREIKKKELLGEKKWLFQEIISSFGNTATFSFLPAQLMIYSYNSKFFENIYGLLLVSFFLVAYGLVSYIMQFIIPSKAKEYLAETYPEYKFS